MKKNSVNPGGKLRAVCWLLTGIFFVYDLYAWGGLALTPKIGEQVRHDAGLHAPIAATYLGLGSIAVEKLGRTESARRFAAEKFPNMPTAGQTDRRHALSEALTAQTSFGALAYYGAPLLGLLSLMLHMTRQKPLRSFGGHS